VPPELHQLIEGLALQPSPADGGHYPSTGL
jgi:hypothetical protein